MRFLLLFLVLTSTRLLAQPTFPAAGYVFDDTVIPKIYLEMPADSVAEMYDNPYNDKTYQAKFIFVKGVVRDTIQLVGVEIRGNTSRNATKKSIQVDVNHYVKGQEYKGLEALNLNGGHNDPSLVRTKLIWDLFAAFKVPAARANHVELYINNQYRGIYTNTEPIDDEFVKSRFGSESGNLYKCLYPADLTWKGSDPNAYKFIEQNRRVYELRTNEDIDDYTDLKDLIYSITQLSGTTFQTEFQKRFNVDNYLKALAIEVSVGHWDNYWGNMNNYYLYKNPKTGKFEYIPYDTDNTFGIDWIGGNWGTKNVFTWASTSASTRPLINKIMGVAEWKNRYAYYLKQLKDTHFNLTAMGAKIDALKNALYTSANNDPLRSADYGWTMTDYVNSFDAPLGGHVAYGLKPYITTRNNSTTTQIGTVANIAPIVRYDVATPQVARGGTPIQFTAQLEDESTALTVKIFIKEGASTLSFDMKDDGLNGDGIAGDKTYTYQWVTNNRNASLTWYMTASDGVKTTTTVEQSISLVMQSAFINELLASNSTGITDEVGEFEDWIELYNGGTSAINLNGTFLTDDPAVLNKWALPNQMLNANSRILVWADNQLTQGTLHANFKLEKNGESVVWSRLNGTVYEVIDRVDFGVQVPDKSYSRSGDGGISWFIANAPTPNLPNQIATAIETELPANLSVAVFPNPFVQNLQLTWQLETPQPLKIDLVDVLGRERALIFDGLTEKGSLNWESQFLASGVYWIRLKVGDKTYLRRIVKLN